MVFRRAGLLAALLFMASSNAFSADCLMGRYEPNQSGFTSETLKLPVSMSWEYTSTKFDNNPAAPVVADGTCYFASGSNIYAVDLVTGAKIWQYPAGQPLAGAVKGTPLLYGDNIYFTSADGNMYSLDANTGTFQWAYQARGPIRCSPIIDESTIFFGADDNSVYAVDADTGELVWKKPFTARDDFAHALAVGSGIVVACSTDGIVYGINESTGRAKWMYRMSDVPLRTSPILMNNVVVMAVGDCIYGISVRSGQLKWFIKLADQAAATPACNGMDLYVPCRDKKLYAYTFTGRQPVLKWTEPVDLGASPMSSPTIANDTIFITTSKGVVAAYSVDDGTLKWRYIATPSQVTNYGTSYTDATSSPIVADQSLFVLTDDGVLRCFKPDAPDSAPPTEFNLKPSNAVAMSGVPPIKMSAVVYDIGSGVDFSTVTMALDGNALAYETDITASTVSYVTEATVDGKTAQKLDDGVHTITLTAKDYSGNTLTKEWFFFADNSLPPPKKPEIGKKTKEPEKAQPTRTRPSWSNRRQNTNNSTSGTDAASPPPPPPMPGGGGDDNTPAMPEMPD